MKNQKTNPETAVNEKEVGGYRAHADDYKHIINDYMLRLTVIKESNIKFKNAF